MAFLKPLMVRNTRKWFGLLVLIVLTSLITPPSPVHSAPTDNTGIKIPILAYHNVAVDPQNDPWTISTADFIAELDVLRAYGYQTVTLQDYLDYEANLKIPPTKSVILTFDDGYEGMYTEVLPALTARSMTASFFIPTGKIAEDDENRVDNSWSSSTRLDYHLIWPEIQLLAAAGMEIGSHSVTHPDFSGISIGKIIEELTNSRTDLVSHLPGKTINSFAFPYGIGGNDAGIRDLVRNTGYSLALDYDPPDDLAVLGVSELHNLPRRNMINGVSLVLDTQDPWWFFMRRLDPEYPIPDISLTSIEIRDAEGRLRTKLVPGELASVTASARNSTTASAVDASVQLVIERGGEVVYDSHLQLPSEDVVLSPFPNNSEDQSIQYSWQIPNDAALGNYSYLFCVNDITDLLTLFCSGPSPLVELAESPVSILAHPGSLNLAGAGQQQVDFTINNAGPMGGETYLTVSLSPKLRIVESIPSEAWYHRGVGETINCKTGQGCSMPAKYEIYVVNLSELASGPHTFSLVVSSQPGAGPDEWLRYRLAVHTSPNPIIPGEWFLRWPFYGEPDQQGWYSAFMPVSVQRSDIFLPLITE